MKGQNQTLDSGRRNLVCGLGLACLIGLGMFGVNEVGHYRERKDMAPVSAEICDANNDSYKDMRIRTVSGREFILYGNPEGNYTNNPILGKR